jgi:hypothetical protein
MSDCAGRCRAWVEADRWRAAPSRFHSPRERLASRAAISAALTPAVRRQSNLNFLFRLSLKFYRLVSSSVARGAIPERSEAIRRPSDLHGLAEIKQWNRSRTGNCGNEPSGDRPDGSFYCWAALAGARRSIRSQDPLRPHGDVDRNARTLSSWTPLPAAMRFVFPTSSPEPRFTYNAAAAR